METLGEGEGETRRVNVVVSHMKLAEGIQPLKGTRPVIRSQAQDKHEGPRKHADNSKFKDLTNKYITWPTIAKSSRPVTKVNGSQQKENIKMLKRAGQAWRNEEFNGPPLKSPFDPPITGRPASGNGLDGTRPPDPPDASKTPGESLECPKSNSQQDALGKKEGDAATACSMPQASDVDMDEIATADREGEVVRATQF